jgi:hypothetical protein
MKSTIIITIIYLIKKCPVVETEGYYKITIGLCPESVHSGLHTKYPFVKNPLLRKFFRLLDTFPQNVTNKSKPIFYFFTTAIWFPISLFIRQPSKT